MKTTSRPLGKQETSVVDKAASGKPLSYGPLGQLVGFAVRRLHSYLSAGNAAVVERAGLRPHQVTTLSLIVDNPGISQSQLARALGIKPSNIVPLVDDLEQRGLVVRSADPATRRKYALAATKAGRALRDRALALVAEYEEELLGILSPAERAMLLSMIDRLGG